MRTLLSAAPTDRVGRYPKHKFLTREIPFSIQPIMLARVLPGETLQNLHFEARVVTDPIKNPLIGWKKEFYFFYVKATDLMLDAFKDMFVDPTNAEITGQDVVGNYRFSYTAKGGIDWTNLSLIRIVETYFRDEGETANSQQYSDSSRVAQIRDGGFLDSLTDKDDMPEGDAISGATDAGDLDRLMDAYEMLRAMGISNMTYEDWLRSQGIAIPNKDENKPELIARFSDYQYPTNIVEPTTGVPASAVSWLFNNSTKSGQKWFFKEPGFIVGISITRPKVYFGGLAGSMAGFAKRAWDWVPNYMADMPETGLKNFAINTGPLGDRTAGTEWDAYWLDMRDDLIHGDQWHNMRAFTPALAVDGTQHMFALPDANGNWKYPAEADVKAIFKTPATNFYVRQDGYVSLNIKGKQVDYTVGNFAEQ